jgi:SAM-dependent methyltransferase
MNLWNSAADNYDKLWIQNNLPLIKQSIDSLPELPKESKIHIPGIGPGHEIPLLEKRYPFSKFCGSDNSLTMIQLAKHYLSDTDITLENIDILDIPYNGLNASISFFVIHLIKNPLEAVKSQWKSIKPGGFLAALYYPPTPLGDGPLTALHNAARSLNPRLDSKWEDEVRRYLLAEGVADISFKDFNTNWELESLSQYQQMMEVLPHISSIKARAGVEFHKKLWEVTLSAPGLKIVNDKYIGKVGARLVIAHKP